MRSTGIVGLGSVRAIVSGSSVRLGIAYAVGGEKTVDILGIVQRIIHEECQFGRLTQLITHALSQFVAYSLGRGIDTLDDFGRPLGGEYGQIGASHRQVGADTHGADTHQRAMGLGGL